MLPFTERPPTALAARGVTHRLLDEWLAAYPAATLNGWSVSQARLGFVDRVAPLLHGLETGSSLTASDIAAALRTSPAALLGSAEADTARAAFAAAWQMILDHWLLPARRRPGATRPPVPPLPCIHHTLLVIRSYPESLTMEDLTAVSAGLEAHIGDQSDVCFAYAESPDQLSGAQVLVLCMYSPA